MAGLPERIGNFEVVRQIGAGGMGAVYLGRDPELNRQVAIKVIREQVRDPEILERFFREARAAAALRHPNIITIYASGQHEHQPFIAMEFVEGESLADVIRERSRLTLDQKIAYIDQICAGLHFAHRAGIVHRDIKPANVMVDRDEVVRILDFGIARVEGSAMTQDGALIGSLNYMSPEQMLGRAVDHRSDIFSVGSLAYELLTYQQAFKGTLNDGLLHRLPNEDPPPLTELDPSIPPEVHDVVMRALAKEPDQRFQHLADMRAALSAAKIGMPAPPEDRTIAIRRADAPLTPTVTSKLEAELFGNTQYDGNYMRAYEFTAPPTPQPEPEPQVPHSQVFEGTPQVEASASAERSALEAEPSAATPAPEPPAPPPGAVTPPAPTVVETRPQTVMKPPTVSGPATLTGASTVTRPPTVAKPATVARPATAVPRTQIPPPAVAAGASRKWIAIAAVVVVLGAGAFVAIPMFTAQPNPIERERPRVLETMEQFRSAYRNRNLNGIVAVFPSIPRDVRQSMQRAFDRCLIYEVTFSSLQVDLNPDATAAKVDVRSVHECTPNSNEPQSKSTQQDVFTLQRQGESWSIASVARAASSTTRSPQRGPRS